MTLSADTTEEILLHHIQLIKTILHFYTATHSTICSPILHLFATSHKSFFFITNKKSKTFFLLQCEDMCATKMLYTIVLVLKCLLPIRDRNGSSSQHWKEKFWFDFVMITRTVLYTVLCWVVDFNFYLEIVRLAEKVIHVYVILSCEHSVISVCNV